MVNITLIITTFMNQVLISQPLPHLIMTQCVLVHQIATIKERTAFKLMNQLLYKTFRIKATQTIFCLKIRR